ncbi:hypothetical protein F5Y16DRAFT_418677 [Xylariaceae sp. FL0255]|nr:hypothetical protein F5Y16DRAFT_418677 [Xylariaceae sp. FL0255]
MNVSTIVLSFRATAILAFILLWGLYALNGALKENLLAPIRGSIGDTSLKNDYTGIFLIDYPLTVLVSFFWFGSNGSNGSFQLLVFEGYSTLESAFVWLYVESIRPGDKTWAIATPGFFATLWQFAGGAIALPLYYAYHILWEDNFQVRRVQDENAARSLPFSFLLGAILPAIICLAPTWEGPESRSVEAHQTLLAVFQANPIYVALIQASLVYVFEMVYSRTRAGPGLPSRAAYQWIRGTYVIAAFCSTTAHVYTWLRVLASTEESVTLMQMRVPFYAGGIHDGLSHVLARGTLVYLQFDVLIFDLVSLAWAFTILSRLPNCPISKKTLLWLLFIGWVVIGAGGTVSLALYMREGLLPEQVKDGRQNPTFHKPDCISARS